MKLDTNRDRAIFWHWFSGQGGGGEVDPLDNFDIYADIYAASGSLSNEQELAAPNFNIDKGTLTARILATGVIDFYRNKLRIDGSGNDSNTGILGEPITEVNFGDTYVFRLFVPSGNPRGRIGFFENGVDLFTNNDSNFLVAGSNVLLYNYQVNGFTGASIVIDLEEFRYQEQEFIFVAGGFDVDGLPYTGGDTTGYEYGYFAFFRGSNKPYWKLCGWNHDLNLLGLTPFVSGESTGDDMSLMSYYKYKLDEFDIVDTFFNTASDEEFTIDINNAVMAWQHYVADGTKVDFYFCIDDYDTITEGYRLECARSTSVTYRLYRIDEGVETLIATSQTSNATDETYITIKDGIIYYSVLSNFPTVDVSTYASNTLAKIVGESTSQLRKFMICKEGNELDYKAYFADKMLFFDAIQAPGYGLVGETRTGVYFDVSSISTYTNIDSTGVFAYLVNGSSNMTVKYRNHSQGTWITDLQTTVPLDAAYSGTNRVIYIGSDIHIQETNDVSADIFTDLVLPDLTSESVTDVFILGDLVQDFDGYATYLAMKAQYASADWYELTGNHDVEATFLTELGYADTNHVVTIGNCTFIMVGWSAGDESTFIANSIDAGEANCFIMSHNGRKDTTAYTDTSYLGTAANIDTVLSTRSIVAWFAGHSHGDELFARISNDKVLDLGDSDITNPTATVYMLDSEGNRVKDSDGNDIVLPH